MKNSRPIDLAFEYHRAGRLGEAEGIYRQLLAREPNHPDALHLLGMLVGQMGRPDEAVNLIDRAITSKPAFAAYHCNLGNMLRASGNVDRAIAAYREAIRLQPDFAEAMSNLSNVLKEKGELDEAITAGRRAIQLRPRLLPAYNNLIVAMMAKDQFQEVIPICRQAIQIKPDVNAYNNLGTALANVGQVEQAIVAFRQAVSLKPDFAMAHNNLGQALLSAGRVDEAIVAYRQAIQWAPNYGPAHCNLGVALAQKNRCEEALGVCRRAIQLSPDSGKAYNSMGIALAFKGEYDEAVAAYRKSIELVPDHAGTYYNLGNALREQGQLDESLACMDSAIALKPDDALLGGCRLYLIQFHPGYDAAMIRKEHAEWNRRHAVPLKKEIRPHENDASPERRLRIGYVSPDFNAHVVGRNMLPLLSAHDHSQFEIHCFSNVVRPDVITARFQHLADQWHDTKDLRDTALADLIRSEKIDILVDWTLHMTGCHLGTFARKPAPVQVTFAGYPGSTGLEVVDYRLTDPYLDPPGQTDADYVEKSIRLPESFWCYDTEAMTLGLTEEPEVGPLPSLAAGCITFGCLNNFGKINPAVLDLWGQVLNSVPDSHLMMLAPVGSPRQRIRTGFEQAGIAATRVQFVDFRPRGQYLQLYHQIDIGLETFPYNGHTTSLDALWMGVPVITLVGSTVVGRAGVSQLTNLGLTDLIARTPEEYVKRVTALARDANRLGELRSTLRQRIRQSPLGDGVRFARNIETAYRQMWRTWCAAQPPPEAW